MKLKNIVYVIIFSIILQVIISPLRGYVNIQSATAAGYIIYILFCSVCFYLFSRNLSLRIISICAIAGILIIQLPIRIISFNSTLYGLPDMFAHIAGIISFYFYKKGKGFLRWFIPVGLACCMFFLVTKGYGYWEQKLNNGDFFGDVKTPKFVNYSAIEESGVIKKHTDYKGKIVLMDFWFIG